MSAFTNLIANLFSGFIPSVISMFTGLDRKGWTPDSGAQHVAEDLASLQDQDLISNYFRKTTGSSLTNAEREANEWSRQQSIDAWSRQMEADNTKYQRQVADMQAAGLNPMLAAGASAHVPTAAVASSVSPSAAAFNIGDLFSLLRLNSDIKVNEASANEKNANAEKSRSQTKGQDIINNYEEERQRLEMESRGLVNSLTRGQIVEVNKQIEDLDSQISLRVKQEKSEVEKAKLIVCQSILADVNARQVVELLPYSKVLMSAQSEQAKNNAAFAAAQAAYQNGMLSSGMIEAVLYKTIAERKSLEGSALYTEVKKDLLNIEKSLREGKTPENWDPESPAGAIVSTVYALLEMINPLSKLGM